MAELLYRKVYAQLLAELTDGTFAVGDRLPSEAELTSRFHVSSITLKRALDLLRTEGYIVRRPRLGTFVVSTKPSAGTAKISAERPLIGCVITNFDDTFGSRVLEGMLSATDGTAHLVVKRTRGITTMEDEQIRSLIGLGVRGLLLLPSSSEFVPPAILELVSRKFPVVILDRTFDGVPVSSIRSDNVSAASDATAHLFSLGHRRVGFVSSSSAVSSTEERRHGYVKAHAEFHVPLDNAASYRSIESTRPESTVSPNDDLERLLSFVTAHPEITAYVAAEYNIAVMLKEALRRTGREVPADVSIVCFDHPQPFLDYGIFHFTHVRQRQQELGSSGVELLVTEIGRPGQIERRLLETELVLGDSTAPPPQS